ELHPPRALAHLGAGGGRVGADVVGDGGRLVQAAPAEHLGAPGEVGVGGPALQVDVEDLALDGDVLQRRAPVDGGGPVGAEDLRRARVRRGGRAVTHQTVLAPAVPHHAGRV